MTISVPALRCTCICRGRIEVYGTQLRSAPSPGEVCATTSGVDLPTFLRERPGLSTFVLQDGAIYHTYSAYGRGVDAIWGMYQWLDRAPFGRNEHGVWWRRHDEYGKR
jgi:predicted dithiol-disulfide oxidoreductase (DUF899 family)